jgi:hypothetical protein
LDEIFLAIDPMNSYLLLPDRTVGCGGVGRAKKILGLGRRLEAFFIYFRMKASILL